MERLSKRELAAKRKEQEDQERERVQAKKEADFIGSAQRTAMSVVPQEQYDRGIESSKRFAETWDSSRNRKHILTFVLRRIASLVESSYLANAASAGAKSAAWNLTGALLGGAEGAGSMSQMGVQNADMQYRTARIAADNLYQLARDVKEMDADLDPDLMERAKDAALRIKQEGFGKSFENIGLLIAAGDSLVSYAYGWDTESVNALVVLEHKREEAFKKFWNDNYLGTGLPEYDHGGSKYYRRLFHGAPN